MIRRLGLPLLTIAALLCIANVVCHAQALPALTHNVRQVVLNGQARQIGHLPATQNMRLVLALPLRNPEELDNFLQALYDPSSMSYRHFLTVEEFTARFGPTQEDYDAVIHFAEANGFTVVGTSRNRLNLDVTGSVANIEEAFHIKMGVYQHPTENRTFFAPDREPTPFLSVQLWHISGLDNYSIPHPNLVHRNVSTRNANGGSGSGLSASYLGSDMRAAYYGGTLTGTGQYLGLLEYYGTDIADLNTYFKNIGQTNNVPINLVSTDGSATTCFAASGCSDTEQTIDMTQALGMAPGLTALYVYIGSTDAAIFNAMAQASPLCAQLSSSWSWYPADLGTDLMYFKEFAAQGQNLFQASGDDGEWNSRSEVYPADSIYVTSVGGTALQTSSAGGPWSSETAWEDGGGGISPDNYAIPSWQTATAAGCSACSKGLRNGPDVSANASSSFYVCANQTSCTANEWEGTSFAAPMWAGFLALVNQQAAANSNPPLGFINPMLYTLGLSSNYTTDFHDIISGGNGFPATTGFDLATGWGSPNGPALLNALLGAGPPPSGFSLSALPTTVSVSQGSSGSSVITTSVTGGFSSAISLAATGQPAGVTLAFSQASITGAGTSSLTFTVSSTAVVGTYTITVSGSSGSTTETATVTLKVTKAKPTFAISGSPASITVSRGAIGTATITTTISGGFSSAITFTATGAGNAQIVSFAPSTIAAPGNGTSIMSVAVSATATLGTHRINVKGTASSTSHSTIVVLNVVD